MVVVVAWKWSFFNYTVVAMAWHISKLRKTCLYFFFLGKNQNNNKQTYNNIIA